MAYGDKGYGSAYGGYGGGGYGTTNPRVKQPNVDIIDQMEAYSPLLSGSQLKKYQETKDEKDKPTWFQKVISILSTGETGQAVYDMLDGKNPVASYGKSVIDSIQGQGYDKKTYADVLEKLGMKRGALSELMPWLYNDTGKGIKFKKGGFLDPTARGTLGLALDILGDPTTYLGGAGLFKRGSATAMKAMTKEGKFMTTAIMEEAEKLSEVALKAGKDKESIEILEVATSKVAEELKKKPDKYFKGLTFMGQEVLPRKVVLGPGRYGDKLLQHIPIVNSVYEGAKNGIQDVFKYGADMLRAGNKLGDIGRSDAEMLIQMETKARRQAEYGVDNLMKSLYHEQKDFYNAVSKSDRDTARSYIREKIETSGLKATGLDIDSIDTTTLDNISDIISKYNKQNYDIKAAGREGLQKEMFDELSGYLTHIMTPEAKKIEAALNPGKYKGSKVSDYAIKNEKSRKLLKFVDEDGKEVIGEAGALGLLPYSKPAEEAFLERGFMKLIKTQENHLRKIMSKLNKNDRTQMEYILKYDTQNRYIPKRSLQAINKLKRLAETAEGRGNIISQQIDKLNTQLQESLAELPDAGRYFKDKSGKVFTVQRSATINEANELMASLLEKKGMPLPEGKTYFETDPFAITAASGQTAIREASKNNLLKDITERFGRQGETFEVVKRNEKTGKIRIETKYESFLDEETGINYIPPGDTLGNILPEGTLLPDYMVPHLKKTFEVAQDEKVMDKILQGYDNLMNSWKGAVYGWFPSSHGRNYIGGSFNNFLANPSWVKYTPLVKKVLRGGELDNIERSVVDDIADPLIQEARKYKSADEFVKAKVNTYHGGAKIDAVDLDKSSYNKTFFVSDSAEYANEYTGKTKGGVLNDMHVKSEAKIIDTKNIPEDVLSQIKKLAEGERTGKTIKIQKPDGTYIDLPEAKNVPEGYGNLSMKETIEGAIRGKSHYAEAPGLVDIYKKLGYDGMVTYEDAAMRGKNLGIWNKDIILTKSQLTDIYNKTIEKAKNTSEVLNLGEKNIYKNYTVNQWQKVIGEGGFGEQFGAIMDMNNLQKTLNKSVGQKISDIPMKAGALVEANLRIPLFFSEIADGKTIDEALHTVYKYHFDYAPQAATEVERTVLKRLIPFYTWTKNAIPLMLEELIAQPGKMTGFYKAVREASSGDGEIDRTLLPSYLEKEGAMVRGDSVLSGTGMPPLQILQFFGDPINQIESSLSPLLKIPIEIRTNFNLFKDKAITEDKSGTFAENYPQVVKDWLEWEDRTFTKDGKEIKYSVVNPMRKYWMYAMPTGRLSGIISMTLGENEQNKVGKILTGISEQQLDLERLKATKEKEYEDKLMEIMMDAGIFSQYGTAFKGSKEKLIQQQYQE